MTLPIQDPSRNDPTNSESGSRSGSVALVGAGPGDPCLITLAGKLAIEQADAVLYDGLVNPVILQWAPTQAEKICVGKRGHGGSWKQSEIDDLIVKHARLGQRVVRLKGGDSAIFARSCEEIERLERENIPYRLIPGISAALAVHAYAGIPLTHRDWASSLALVSGQLQLSDANADHEERIDWTSLATFPGTLVLYMALHSAPTWSHELIQGGKSPNTPVALIRHCSLPDQEILFCELSQVPQTLTQNPKFTPPVLVVIGDVLRAKHLPPTPASPSKSSLPLASENILVTSPIEPTDRLPQALRTLGANVIVQPAIEILPANPEPILSIIDQLDQFDSLVFSSRHGVHHFLSLLMNSSRDARALAHLKIAAVGHATAQALLEFGLRADWCPTHNAGADALLDQWLPHAAHQRILLIQTPTGKSTLQTTLQPIGKSITPLDVYLQSPVPKWPSALSTNLPRNTIVTATSSNIATESFRLLGPIAKELRWLSISQAVSETLTKLGAKQVYTAANPSYDGICQASLTIAKRLEE